MLLKTVVNILIAILCLLCIYAQFYYKVLSGNFFVIIISLLGEILFFLWLILAIENILGLLERIIFVRLFLYIMKICGIVFLCPVLLVSGFVLINGVFAGGPVIKQPSVVTSLSRIYVPGLEVSYGWLSLRSEDKQGRNGKVLISPWEYGKFWPGENIMLSLRKGVFGLYHVTGIERDMEKYYQRILDVSPASSVALKGLISTYLSDNKLDNAVREGRKYYALYPFDNVTVVDLGGALAVSGRYQEAAEFLEKAVSSKKDDYEAYRLLGWVFSYSGIDRNRAKEAFLKAIEINPYDWRAYYNLGYTYMGLGDCVNEKKMWQKVLEIQPNFPEVQNLLNRCKCNDEANGKI